MLQLLPPTHLTIAILLCGYALLSCKYSMDYCVDTPYYWWHWKPHYQSHTTEPCYIDRGIFWGGAAMEVSALGSTTSNTPLSSVTVVGIDKKNNCWKQGCGDKPLKTDFVLFLRMNNSRLWLHYLAQNQLHIQYNQKILKLVKISLLPCARMRSRVMHLVASVCVRTYVHK